MDLALTVGTLRQGAHFRVLFGWVCLFGAIALWSVTTPKYAAPDEPANAINAAAAARGELIGQKAGSPSVQTMRFTVPATIAHGTDPGCLVFNPAISAGCLTPWKAEPGSTKATSYVGAYPPLYYVLTGLPSDVTHDTNVLLWMRLVSALLAAVFLTASFVSASRMAGARWSVVGVAVAISPMVFFISGVVNSSALEISSALCLWTSGLALFTRPDPRYRRSLIFWTALSACTFVQTRGLSPLFLLVIAGLLLALAGARPLLRLLRRRDVQLGVAALAVCSVFAVVWVTSVGSLKVVPSNITVAKDASTWQVFTAALHKGLEMKQLVGVFGWLDTFMPAWCYVAWEVVCVVLAIVLIARRQARVALVAAAAALATVAIPTLIAFAEARKIGLVGQGRDILPIAVGVPVLMAYGIARSCPSPAPRWLRGGAVVVGLLIAAVQFSGFVQALHRYRTGVNAPILTHQASWSPPIPALFAVGAFALLQLALVWWWTTLPAGVADEHRTEARRPPSRPAPAYPAPGEA